MPLLSLANWYNRSMKLKDFLKAIDNLSTEQILRKYKGTRIGTGIARRVYEIKGLDGYVMKVQKKGYWCNVLEWSHWVHNQYWEWLAKYLARCVAMTWDGKILIQERIYPWNIEDYPEKLPWMFTDTKYQNYWFVDGQIKCCDYHTLLLWNTIRPRKVLWWE